MWTFVPILIKVTEVYSKQSWPRMSNLLRSDLLNMIFHY